MTATQKQAIVDTIAAEVARERLRCVAICEEVLGGEAWPVAGHGVRLGWFCAATHIRRRIRDPR